MNLKIAAATVFTLSLSASTVWCGALAGQDLSNGSPSVEDFLMAIAGQGGADPCAAASAANPGGQGGEQVPASCQAARTQAAKKAAGNQATAGTTADDSSLQNADALGDALGSTVSDFSPTEQGARSAAQADSKAQANARRVAAASALKKQAATIPAPSGHYGPAGLNQTVPAAFKAAEQAANGLNQQ
ncbi:MAG TPA: hypothetical protein VNK24_06320 [Elusimicrobiota bacterium]|nr:hypothetical protein [Elusimicrobiota bacterium]